MNKGFKRVLSSILAFVMMLSCVTLINLSTVLASNELDGTTGSGTYTSLSETGVYTYDFAGFVTDKIGTPTSNTTVKINDGVDSITKTSTFYGLNATKLQVPSGETGQVKFSGNDSYISFTLADGYKADVTIKGTTGSSSKGAHYSLKRGSTAGQAETGTLSDNYDSLVYSGITGGFTYYITRPTGNGNGRITGIEIAVTEANYTSGTLTLNTSADEGVTEGTVTVADASGNIIENGGTVTVTGGTKLTVTASPSTGTYALVTVNNTAVTLTSNAYTWIFDDNTTVNVTFKACVARSPITTAGTYYSASNTATEANVVAYGEYSATDYYFDLADGATLTSGKRITVSTGSGTYSSGLTNSVLFDIGDLDANTAAVVTLSYASSGSTARTLQIKNSSDEVVGTFVTSATAGSYLTGTVSLGTGSYYITSAGSGIYINKIAVEISSLVTVTPSFSSVTNGTYTVGGQSASIGDSVTLAEGTYTVKVKDSSGNVYNGTLTVASGNESPEVELTQASEFWFDDYAETSSSTDTDDDGNTTTSTSTKVAKGEYKINGGTVTLLDDFVQAQSYTYNGYKSYQGSTNAKALDSNGSTISSTKTTTPASGNAYSFTPDADGRIVFYGATTTSYSLLAVDTEGNAALTSCTNTTADAVSVKATGGYTYYMFANSSGSKTAFIGFEYTQTEKAVITGTVSLDSGLEEYYELPSTITFTNEDGSINANINAETGAYSVELEAGVTYTVATNSAELMVSGTSTITPTAAAAFDVVLIEANTEEVIGAVYTPVDASGTVTMTFTNTAGTCTETVDVTLDGTGKTDYTVDLLPGTYTTNISSTLSSTYTLSEHSTDSFTVVQGGDENWKYVLYTEAASAVADSDIYVDAKWANYKDGIHYGTIREAMAAVDVSSLDSYTVHLTPGATYKEQVIVKSDNVTFTTDNGEDATITWYYGFCYDYYSVNPSTGRYDEEYALLKFSKDDPSQSISKWAATVIVEGDNFYAENIVFEDSYNFRVTEEEIADGVAPAANPYQGTAGNDRTVEGFDPKTKANTERAAAICIPGAKAEFYQCSFLSSQDTVVTNSASGKYYMNDCLIVGETDYICGYGNLIVDNSQLYWKGYSNATKTNVGYITAAQGYYLLRNCEIGVYPDPDTDTKLDVIPGYYGRPWLATCTTIFVNTTIEDGYELADLIDATSTDTTTKNGTTFYKTYKGWGGGLLSANPYESDLYTVEATHTFNNDGSDTEDSIWSITSQLRAGDEYGVDGSTFTSEEDVLTAADITGKTYLSSWIPATYTYASTPNTYDYIDDGFRTYDFVLYNADDITAVTAQNEDKETGLLEVSNMTKHGSTYGAYTSGTATFSFTMSQDASTTDVTLSSSYNKNQGTATIYVNGTAMQSDLDVSTTKDAATFAFDTLTDLKEGDVVKVSITNTNTSGSFYSTGLTVKTNGRLTSEATAYNTYGFTYTEDLGTIQSTTAVLESASATSSDGTSLAAGAVTLNAISGKFLWNSTSAGAQINTGSKIEFTLDGEGTLNNVVTINGINHTSFADNGSGTVNLYSSNDTTTPITSATIAAGDISLEFKGEAGDYYVEFVYTGSNDKIYSTGVTIKTTGTVAGSGETVTPVGYTFDFTTATAEIVSSTESYNTSSDSEAGGSITLDATEGDGIKIDSVTTHGLNFKENSAIEFVLGSDNGAETVDVTIALTKTANDASVTVYNTKDTTTAVASSTSLLNDTNTLTFTGTVGDTYKLVFGSGSVYISTMVITTAGTVSAVSDEETVTPTDYTFDFATNQLGLTAQEAFSENKDYTGANDSAVTLVPGTSSIYYHSTDYGMYFKSGSAIEFVLDPTDSLASGATDNVTITFAVKANALTANVYSADDTAYENSLASAEISNSTTNTLSFEGTAGKTYVILFSDSTTVTSDTGVYNSFYVTGMTVTTAGTVSAIASEEPVVTNTYDFTYTADLGTSGTVEGSTAVLESASATSSDETVTLDAGSVTLDATSGKFRWNDEKYGDQINNGSKILFTLEGEGTLSNTVTIKYITNTSLTDTSTVKITNSEGTVVAEKEITTGDLEVTFEGEAGQYTIEFAYGGSSDSIYSTGVTITTTGTVAAESSEEPVVTNTYDFTYTESLGTVEGSTAVLESASATSSDETVTLSAGLATLDATSGKFRWNNESTGDQINSGSKILFTLVGEGTLSNTVTIKYINNTTITGTATVNITDSEGNVVATKDITTGDLELTFEGEAGQYTIEFVYEVSSDKIYSTGVTVETTGTIAALGDVYVDGVIDNKDAAAILKIANGADVSSNTSINTYTADVNKDGNVDMLDSIAILKSIAA